MITLPASRRVRIYFRSSGMSWGVTAGTRRQMTRQRRHLRTRRRKRTLMRPAKSRRIVNQRRPRARTSRLWSIGLRCEDCGVESVRVDRWLVAVRVFKTRGDASDACAGGKVRVNGRGVKAASVVRVGDRVVARVGERVRDVEVVRLIEKRVGAGVAAECFVDHSESVEPRRRELGLEVASREPGAGRPTKRDRRAMEKFRGR
ncbi:MAG: RNA-binding S4 domain-containing protein [Solirubrobacterales bacterium]